MGLDFSIGFGFCDNELGSQWASTLLEGRPGELQLGRTAGDSAP